eukprot:RCo019678
METFPESEPTEAEQLRSAISSLRLAAATQGLMGTCSPTLQRWAVAQVSGESPTELATTVVTRDALVELEQEEARPLSGIAEPQDEGRALYTSEALDGPWDTGDGEEDGETSESKADPPSLETLLYAGTEHFDKEDLARLAAQLGRQVELLQRQCAGLRDELVHCRAECEAEVQLRA